MRPQSLGSSMTHWLSGVRTPPGSMLLHVPCGARRPATFLVYAMTPPLDAAYSGNSLPVCPLADPTLTTARTCGAGFDRRADVPVPQPSDALLPKA